MLYSIFTNDIPNNIDLIDKIKNFFQQYHNATDFVILTDDINHGLSSHAILNSFYMIASNGYIIFLNLNDYYLYRDQMVKNAILYLTQEDISNIDRNIIKNCSVLIENDNELQWIKNHELQQAI
jgi:hypothetical protein